MGYYIQVCQSRLGVSVQFTFDGQVGLVGKILAYKTAADHYGLH